MSGARSPTLGVWAPSAARTPRRTQQSRAIEQMNVFIGLMGWFDSSQRNNLTFLHRTFFSFTNLHGTQSILRRDDRGRLARADAFDEVFQFPDVAIGPFAADDASRNPFLAEAQGILPAAHVVVGRGPLEVDRVTHAETES